jgi:hypothetical protein
MPKLVNFHAIKKGDWLIAGYEKHGLGQVQQIEAYGVMVGDGGFMPDLVAETRLAIVNTNVCRKPVGRCFCGLMHTSPEVLARLPRA